MTMTPPQTVRLPVLTPINAGRSIPDDYMDWEITGFRDIRLIDGYDEYTSMMVVPVDGDSLQDVHILDGDLLICHATTRYEDGKIGIWQTPHGPYGEVCSLRS